MNRILLLLFCFIVRVIPAAAQPDESSYVQQFTTENGLPSNGIKGLQWDEKTNFLWLATEAGIVRYNGVDFRTYTKENMRGIATERMLFMTRNNAGAIYISDLSGNIFHIDQNKPVLWKKAAENINPYFDKYYLLQVSDTFFNKETTGPPNLKFSAVTDKVVCLSDTSCFILKAGLLFYQSISLQNPFLHPFEISGFKSIFKIGNTCFLTTDKKEIFLINNTKKSLTPISIVTENGIMFSPGPDNLLYWETGMENPIYIDGENAWLLTLSGDKIIAKLISSSIPLDALIRSIQYSNVYKILFLGTDSKGLIVLKQNKVQSKKTKQTNYKSRNSYYSQIELEDGNILTNEGEVIGNKAGIENPLPIKGKFSYNVSTTNDSLLWYSQLNQKLGYNCLYRFNKKTRQTKVYEKIIYGDIVATSGTSTYAVNSQGLGIIEEDSLRFLYKYPEKYFGNITFDFSEISPGILAIASCNGLLTFNTVTNKIDTLFKEENICVRNIWKYKDYIFFGTYGAGFYIYKNGILKSMPLDKNKYLLYTHCFAPDEKGYCWISTNKGLFKASLTEIIDFFDNKNSYVYYHYFGKNDGMEMTELNGGCTPCALQLKNKTISFPSMDGLLWVDPEIAIPIFPDGEIYIDAIKVDSINLDPDSLNNLQFPSKTTEIIISIGFSAWSNKENLYIDYQLNDTLNWKILNTNREGEIKLINLPSGRYVLRIRKRNGFGLNNFSYKELKFTILTPWHKQGWFYFVCFLLFLGLVALYLRLRTRQFAIRQNRLEMQVAEKTKELQKKNEVLEKNNSIKTRLISIISHDIVTPLKFVTSAGRSLLEKRNLMSEALQQETIQEMTNTSQELQLLSTNILNWIKYQNENRLLVKETFNVHEMVNQVKSVLNSLAHQKKLAINNYIKPDMEIRQYFEPLKILIYNLLTNAINFSENSEISIDSKQENNTVIIKVTDQGVGMTTEQIKNIMADQFIISSANIDNRKGNGLGYLIIKDLVKMMGATLHISSEKGRGTTVSIHLPHT